MCSESNLLKSHLSFLCNVENVNGLKWKISKLYKARTEQVHPQLFALMKTLKSQEEAATRLVQQRAYRSVWKYVKTITLWGKRIECLLWIMLIKLSVPNQNYC